MNKWKIKKLGDPEIAKIILGQSPPSTTYNKDGEGLPFFQGKTDFGETFPTATVWCTKPKKIAEPGDILISVRAPVGPTNWANEKCCIGRGLTAIRPQIDPDYLYYFLKMIEPKLATSGRAGIFNAITKDFLYNLEIPIPHDKNEPKEIVKKIERILPLIHTKTQKILQNHDMKFNKQLLLQSKLALFKSAFEGHQTVEWRKKNQDVESGLSLLEKIKQKRKDEYILLKNSKKKIEGQRWKNYEVTIVGKHKKIPTWGMAKLENLIYTAGRIGWKGLKSSEYTETGPMLISVYCLNYGEEVDYRDALHISQSRYDESPEIQIKNDDILLAKDGSNIGKIGIVKNLPSEATVNSSLLVIRSGEVCIPKFLFYLLSGPAVQNIVLERSHRITIPHLYQKDIKNFILPIPTISEQCEIVNVIESKLDMFSILSKKIEKIEKLKKDTLDTIQTLPYSVLKLAFSGKL